MLGLDGGPWATVPELLFEKKELIPNIQQMFIRTETLLNILDTSK
jgi:hypothetical protein